MPPPEATLPEIDTRRCPACGSEQVVPVGHVVAAGGLIKSEHRCEICGAAFLLVRKAIV